MPQPAPDSQALHTASPASAAMSARQTSSSDVASHSRGRSMDGQSGSPSIQLQDQQVSSRLSLRVTGGM